MSGIPLTPEEPTGLFGEAFDDDAHEAEQRWADTDAWRESSRRTATYSAETWRAIAAEAEAVTAAFATAKRSGAAPTSGPALDAAERHRRHVHERFYPIDHAMHRNVSDLYVSDPRFAKTYDDVEPGLAQYVRDAISANAERDHPSTA